MDENSSVAGSSQQSNHTNCFTFNIIPTLYQFLTDIPLFYSIDNNIITTYTSQSTNYSVSSNIPIKPITIPSSYTMYWFYLKILNLNLEPFKKF